MIIKTENFLNNIRDYIKNDSFFEKIKFYSIHNNYFIIHIFDFVKNESISAKKLHFEIVVRKDIVYLELHGETLTDEQLFLLRNNINLDQDKYEWFEWDKGESIRLKKTFILDESNFEEIKNSLIQMYKDLSKQAVEVFTLFKDDDLEVIEINSNNYKTAKTEYYEYEYLLVGNEKLSKNNNANSYVAYMEYLIEKFVINNPTFVNNKKLSTVQSDIGDVKWTYSHKGYFYRYQHGNGQQVKHIFECYKEFAPEIFDNLKLIIKKSKNLSEKQSNNKDSRSYLKFTPKLPDWDKYRTEGYISIYVEKDTIGDLSSFKSQEEVNLALGLEPDSQKNYPSILWDFKNSKIGDIILVSGGVKKCIGIGIITGEYNFVESEPLYKHRKTVKWLADKEFNYIPLTIPRYPELFRRDMFSPSLIGKEIIQEYLKIYPEYFEIFKQNNLINSLPPLSMESKLTSQESLLLLSLLTKPFSILYGVSGTGKSRVVKELWKKIYGDDYSSYFFKEAVPPNWFDDSEIIGRYNAIEEYIEGSFVTILEKAIKDPNNNYVYLLDEMNLSHIEQYFSQYLSAIEDLNEGTGKINVGKISNNLKVSTQSNLPKEEKIFSLSENYNIKLTLKKDGGGWDKGDTFINAEFISEEGELILESNKNVTDFYRLIIRYFIDNFIIPDNLIKKIDDGKFGNYVNPNDYESYKGYYYMLAKDTLSKVNEIKRIAKVLDEKILTRIKFTFSVEKDSSSSNFANANSENIIYYYNDEEKIIGKSFILPKNIFVVGTINLDETTKSISPKVVDRANLIEFNDLDDFLFISDTNRYDLSFLTQINLKSTFTDVLDIRKDILNLRDREQIPKGLEISKSSEDLLKQLYEFLKVFKLHFSYRTLKEIIIFINIGKKLGITDEKRLLDIAIVQKVLPKLNGIIDFNFKLSNKNGEKFLLYDFQGEDNSLLLEFKNILEAGFVNSDNDFNNSAKKLKRMQQFFNTYQNVNYFLS